MSNNTVGTWNPKKSDMSSRVERTYFDLEYGSNLYRILPPFGTLVESGSLMGYHPIFFLKGTQKTFTVPTIRKTKKNGNDLEVIQACPIFDAVEALKKKGEDLKKDSEAVKRPEVVKFLADLWKMNLDKGYYLNVISKEGKIGRLKIKFKAKESLKARFKELENEGIDPINAGPNNGVFFDFKKIKDANGQTSYEVAVGQVTKKDPTSGRIVKEYDWAPIDESILERMKVEAFDLGTAMYKHKSFEEMKLLATFDAKVIDMVMAKPTSVSDEKTSAFVDAFGEDEDEGVFSAVSAAADTKTAVAAAVTAGTMTKSQALSTDDLINQFILGSPNE